MATSSFVQSVVYKECLAMAKQRPIQLEVAEPPEDLILEEGRTATFECSFHNDANPSCNWYKDGALILHSSIKKITTNGPHTRLDIHYITKRDEGLYTVVSYNKNFAVHAKATLHVTANLNALEAIYIWPSTRDMTVLRKHLRPVTIKAKETIVLDVSIDNVAEEITWYKNNTLLNNNEKKIVKNYMTTILTIPNASSKDSGTYTVVIWTNEGVFSSSTEVVVIDHPLINIDRRPEIVEKFPETIEGNANEELRVTCKVNIDKDTQFCLYKSGKACDLCGDSYQIVDYGQGYMGLVFARPRTLDSGSYIFLVRNDAQEHFDDTSCEIIVRACPPEQLSTKVLRPLMSAVANVGAKVVFDVIFELPDVEGLFNVWLIGRHRVVRSNELFTVIFKGGIGLLYIKEVHKDMAGEVTCELRRVLPDNQSVLVSSSYAYLSVVPFIVVGEEYDREPLYSKGFVQKIRGEEEAREDNRRESSTSELCVQTERALKLDEKETPETSTSPKPGKKHKLLTLIFCRLDDDVCYLHTKLNGFTSQNSVVMFEKNVDSTDGADVSTSYVVFDWKTIQVPTDIRFKIDLEYFDGKREELGTTSHSYFQIQNPPTDKLFKFKIYTIPHLSAYDDNIITFVDTFKDERPHRNYELKTTQQFRNEYHKTEVVLGTGAFGSVMLVKNLRGDTFAVKELKTLIQKKRDTAMREYEIMSRINHDRIVALIDAFYSRERFLIVMECLWGGELFDRVAEEDIKEIDVVCYLRQICDALQYIHSKSIAHLDLKPENIVCLSQNSTEIRIIDFGLARIINENKPTRAIYGTKDYVAPEILNYEAITLACDMWTLGVVTYTLLSGLMPFPGDSWHIRSANIIRCNYNFKEDVFQEVSALAKDFVSKLLLLNPKERMTSSAAMEHEWLQKGPPKALRRKPMRRTRNNMRTFLAGCRAAWQRAGNVVIAAHRLRHNINGDSNGEERRRLAQGNGTT